MGLPDSYQKGNGGFWIAEESNLVVGTIGLLDIGLQTLALRKMFVHDDFRGREFGTAQKLLDTAIAHAKTQGIHKIILGTIDCYKAAIRFYQRNGFVEVKKEKLPNHFPIMKVDTKFFEIDLSQP